MVEPKTGGVRRMGQERWKYLDMANMSFAAGDWASTEGYLKAFLETIKEESKEGMEIKTEFDKIELEKRQQLQDLQTQIKDLGYLEQKDYNTKGREQIEIEALLSRKTVCWTASLTYNLFAA